MLVLELFKSEPRRVILSEQGFHTLLEPEGETLQVASYAYAWEKCRKFLLVDACRSVHFPQ